MIAEEEEETPSSEGANLPFSVLMQQACTIKSKQNEIFRRKFDSWPTWLQHTMFAENEEIRQLRESSYPGHRLSFIPLLYFHPLILLSLVHRENEICSCLKVSWK
jgi:hypothetical protein